MNNATTIIIVDDDKVVQASLKAMFLFAGYAVEAYTSCRSFIETFQTPGKACLILDLHLQDMGAWEPVAFLKKHQFDIPIVLTTRPGDPALQSQLSGAGTLALLEKPLDHDLLLTTVVAVLR